MGRELIGREISSGEIFKWYKSSNVFCWVEKITGMACEIRGDTFENCKSLKSIVIPEGVTRIAAHSFRNCSSLSSVTVPSTVNEIGSSAFRNCKNLRSITIPSGASVNERAFKESPTKISYK